MPASGQPQPSERWLRISDALAEALEAAPAERSLRIEQLCGGDAEMRREVESLLPHCLDQSQFLREPAVATVVRQLARDETTQRLGAWLLGGQIGKGGMAVVYRAERADGHFRKTAAAKILRFGVFGEEVLQRFHRERQILADLDHPNIVSLLDGGVAPDGRPYLVMDLVDGLQPLDYAARRGLSLPRRFELFQKICDAVVYAHGRHVIHRDLKPSNILVTEAGEPKLLDFGIAGLVQPEPAGRAATFTHTHFLTPEYASPEQARGVPAGAASDQYSLALILYELITGSRLNDFHNVALLEALDAIRDRAPDLSSAPAPLRAVLERALAKDAARRYPDVASFAADVRLLAAGNLHVRRRLPVKAGAAVVVAAALTAAAVWWPRIPSPQAPLLRSIPLVSGPEAEHEPTISADGTHVVYAREVDGGFDLFLKAVSGGASQRLTTTPGRERQPQFSPDGRRILFSRLAGQSIHILALDLESRSETLLFERDASGDSATDNVRWATWMPDGQGLLVVDRPGPRVPYAIFHITGNGTRRQLTFPPAAGDGDRQAAASPDGRSLAFIRAETGTAADLYLQPLEPPRAPRRLTHDAVPARGLAWDPDGGTIYYSARNRSAFYSIWRIQPGDGRPPQRLVVEGNGIWLSLARAGGSLQIAYERVERILNVLRWDAPWKPGTSAAVCPSTFQDTHVQAAPDGTRLAITSLRGGLQQVWVCDLAQGNATMVSRPGDLYADSPRWSPDGRRLAFTSQTGDNHDISIVDLASSRISRFTVEPSREGRASWSADGSWIYFRSDRSGHREIWKANADGSGAAVQLTHAGAYEAIEGPRGTLYFAKDRDQPGIFAIPVEGGAERLFAAGVREGLWDVADHGIYWIDQASRLMRRQLWSSRSPEIVATVPGSGQIYSGFSVSRDGRRVFWSEGVREGADIMLLEGVE